MAIEQKICPYPGLRSFTEQESIYFKGRDSHIEKIIELLEKKKFLMLTGASGDGKSSIVYAGLIPNARAGFIKAKFNAWAVVDFRPERAPLKNISEALAAQLGYQNQQSIYNSLSLGFSALIDLYKNSSLFTDKVDVENKVPRLDKETQLDKTSNIKHQTSNIKKNLLILVDQFEEFFTNPENFYKNTPSDEAKTLVNLLLETNRIAISEDIPIYIVCTMRSDYIGHCSAFRGLPELIGNSHYFIPRLNRNEIFQAIDEPSVLSGNKISIRLVERLLYDMQEGIDILPVLQHALYRIWQVANDAGDEVMDLIHYAKVGGMPKDELPKEDQKTYTKWFNRLPYYKRWLFSNPCLENVLDTHANELFETANQHYNSSSSSSTPEISKESAKHIIKTTFTCLTRIDENKAVRNTMTLQEITDIIGDPEIDFKTVDGVLEIFRKQGNTLIRPFSSSSFPETEKQGTGESERRETKRFTHSPIHPSTHSVKNSGGVDFGRNAGAVVLDITHEALIRNWARLSKWASDENSSVITFKDLLVQMHLWVNNNKTRSYLLSSGQLNYFQTWYDKQQPNSSWINRYIENQTLDSMLNTINEDTETPFKLKHNEGTAAITLQHPSNSPQKGENLPPSPTLNPLQATKGEADVPESSQTNDSSNISEDHKQSASPHEIKEISQGKSASQMSSEVSIELRNDGKAKYIETNLKEFLSKSAQNINIKKNLTRAALVVISGLLIVATLAFFNANDQKHEAEHSRKVAKSNEIAMKSLMYLKDDPTIAFRLSEEAYKIQKTSLAKQAIMAAWCQPPYYNLFTGHNNIVFSAKFSPNGKYIVSASADNTARIWDIEGNELKVLTGHTSRVSVANFSSDGKYIITASNDKTAIIWNLFGKKMHILWGHSNIVIDAIFSPDSKHILTRSNDSTVYLRNAYGKTLKIIKIKDTYITSAVFSPDGKLILTACSDNKARLWNLEGREVQNFKGHHSSVTDVQFSPDGKYIVTASYDGTARVWDLRGKCIKILKGLGSKIYKAYFSPDGKKILTQGFIIAGLWDLQDNKLYVLKGHSAEITSSEFSPDGNYIITGEMGTKAMLWDLNGNLVRILKANDWVYSVNFSPDGRYIVTSHNHASIKLWDMHDPASPVLKGHSELIWEFNFSPDGKYIVTASYDNTAQIWDMNGQLLKVLKGHTNKLQYSCFSPDGNLVLTTSYDHTARIWDTYGKELQILKGHQEHIHEADFSPDGKYIVTSSKDKTARLWDVNGNQLHVLKGHKDRILECEFSPDGKYILTCSADETAHLWDLKGNLLLVLKGHKAQVYCGDFSPNGNYIVTGSEDRTARLWKIINYEENIQVLLIKVMQGHTKHIIDVSFSPDGKYIVSASNDATTRLWDYKGNELQVLTGHTDMINTARFSPDSKYILTSSDDGTARLWDLEGFEINVYKGHDGGVQVAKFSPDGKYIVTGSQDGTARIWPVFIEDVLRKINVEKERGNVWEMSDKDRRTFGIVE